MAKKKKKKGSGGNASNHAKKGGAKASTPAKKTPAKPDPKPQPAVSTDLGAAKPEPDKRPTAKVSDSRDTVMLPATLKNALRADYSQLLRIRNVQWLIVLAAVIGALLLGYYLSSIFVPLLVAIAIAYILNPLVVRLEKKGVSRTRAVLLIFIGFIAVSAAVGSWFVASIVRDVQSMNQQASALLEDFRSNQDEWIASWNESTPDSVHLDPKEDPFGRVIDIAIEKLAPSDSTAEPPAAASARAEMATARSDLLSNFQRVDKNGDMVITRDEVTASEFGRLDRDKDAKVTPEEWFVRFGATAPTEDGRTLAPATTKAAEGMYSIVSTSLVSFFTLLLFVVLVPIYTWYFMVGWEKVVERGRQYLPGNHRERIVRILGEIDAMLKAFFRGRIVIVMIITVLTTATYLIFGVKYAVLLGLLGGFGVLVPYAAMVLSWVPALVLIGIDPEAGWGTLIGVTVCFHSIQALEQFVLTPKLLGDAVELHPVTILVGVFVMFSLLGLFGALLAVPLTAIAKTLGREFLLPYFKSLAAENKKRTSET
ncbi:MAG: AI-2E family transporter [Planctomycetes bacterium]|nr:AI-2E family transporter [Planctomycetota bacterium]MCA8945762.1 AI-2E family transporter [Planctomycetota bacterium]